MVPEKYLKKVYAGFLGMNAGIRLGAPLEPACWTAECIRATWGNITGYVKPYRNFAADDDVNGPVYFLRALVDDAKDRDITPQDVARAWLNYTREGKGMFWWGGYGNSTEHTAYLNLKSGISAPQSGSIAQNGPVVAQQIGGQIFIDTWGLVLPGDAKRAADFGEAAASVSHDGEGLWGARFFCAAISHAFVCDDIYEVVRTALGQVPRDSLYRQVTEAVRDFWESCPDDFYACIEMLNDHWGYDRFPGVCHIIPNAGACVLSMLYGGGDFARTIEIAAMCGWDADCNAGNVGTVLGVLGGIEGIQVRYREPIRDTVVLSGISGTLNVLDVPNYAKELALLGYRLAGEPAPETLADSFRPAELYFDFELPGATHGIRLSNPNKCFAAHSTERAAAGSGSLKIVYDQLAENDRCHIYYKTYYERADFDDERYDPAFTPLVWPGQTASLKLYCDQWEGGEMPTVTPYVRLAHSGREIRLARRQLPREEWCEVRFSLPDTDGDLICETGILLEGFATPNQTACGALYLDEFSVCGKAAYTIDFKKQRVNFGNISPFVMNTRTIGAFELLDGGMQAISCGQSEAYSGSYYAADYEISVPVRPQSGAGHMIAVRAQGAMRGYFAGFAEKGFLSVWANDFGLEKLAEVPFEWRNDTQYTLDVRAVGDTIAVKVDGAPRLSFKDVRFAYGMFGCCRTAAGRCLFGNPRFREL